MWRKIVNSALRRLVRLPDRLALKMQNTYFQSGERRMASKQEFVDWVIEQIGDAGEITYKHMFGEFGVYSDGKIFALICDNKLFVKPTESGRKYIGDVVEAPPYPGAKNSFLIEEGLENGEWLNELVRLTCRELPEPKRKQGKT